MAYGALGSCAECLTFVSHTVHHLEEMIESWLGKTTIGEKTVLCLPAQSTGTWLAAAVLPTDDPLRKEMECNPKVETRLAQLPKKQRIAKTSRAYRAKASLILKQWHSVKSQCRQAAAFEQELLAGIEAVAA